MSKKKSSKRNKKLDIIAMAVLHLRLCDPEEAQATLASLPKVIYTCRPLPYLLGKIRETMINWLHQSECLPIVHIEYY